MNFLGKDFSVLELKRSNQLPCIEPHGQKTIVAHNNSYHLIEKGLYPISFGRCQSIL
jgi:hypothetical protein